MDEEETKQIPKLLTPRNARNDILLFMSCLTNGILL